jgi:hypothetical protein
MTACIFKKAATAEMPTTVETTMETPGTEGMTTTAGTQQQQK